MQKEVKKQMQRELYQYYNNKKLLNKLKSENKTSTRRFLYLEQRISYVENILYSLNDFERKAFDIIFKDRANWTYCENFYNISRSTYYNIINKCVLLLAKEWRRSIVKKLGNINCLILFLEKIVKNRHIFYDIILL